MQLGLRFMGQRVDIEDLLDANQVANLLGLSSAGAVSVCARRYEDFPRAVLVGRAGRCQFWLRSDVEAWSASRSGS